MSNLSDTKKAIEDSLLVISDNVSTLKVIYSEFFDFTFIFASDATGKTRLNRAFFNDNHDAINERIQIINKSLDNNIELIKEKMLFLLSKNGFEGISLGNLVYDDSSFNELFLMDLELQTISDKEKEILISDLNELTDLKNKIFNLKYFISMFDTSNTNKYLNKLGMDDLINSKLIFELIDTYALQFEELKEFEKIINDFYNFEEETKTLSNLDSPIELIRRRVDTYVYDNVRYKIILDYNNEVKLTKEIKLSKAYLENIISNFIEQSCMDLIKKELKRGKIQKLIDISLVQTKNSIQLIVRNNGFEEKNIHMLYLAANDNKYIVEARNLARMMNAAVDVSSIDGEGMQYIFDLKIK